MLVFALFLTVAGVSLLLKLTLILISRNAFRGGPLTQPKPQPELSSSGAELPNSPEPAPPLAVRYERGYKLKMDIKSLDFNDQILIINSVLLGDRAKDSDSFTQRLLRWIAISINEN